MLTPSLALWLLFVCTVITPSFTQHWSFGLSPGGKRELDNLSNSLDNIVKRFPHADDPCSVLGCDEEQVLTKTCRKKGLLGTVTRRENGHLKYKN